MSYEAKIILDSVQPTGQRLTTMQVTYPRIVHSELMTHRVFSRNASSSRAIPVKKMIERIKADPFIPEAFWKNKKGMQADTGLSDKDSQDAEKIWRTGLAAALTYAAQLEDIGLHKQLANRILEPYSWITVIITSSYWNNFFAQRCDPNAQPELQKIAYMMRDLYLNNKPQETGPAIGHWHLPYIDKEDFDMCTLEELRCLSVARCARVSYLNQDGNLDPNADFELFQRLQSGGHWSPFEHVAGVVHPSDKRHGNFEPGWLQYRKLYPEENRECLLTDGKNGS